MQNPQHQKLKHQTQRASVQSTSVAAAVAINFTNTAKLPIETVKLLIASVSLRPSLWNRNNNGQKRSDINVLWQQVGQEVNLPANICRVKWGHLRDNFRKVFIRNTLSAEPPTRWRFYNDMRFMETAVAKNVMRHHKLRARFHHWQGLHNDEQQQCSSASVTADLNGNCDPFIPNQFNFSDLSAYFHNQGPAANNRIKVETFESETSLQDSNDFTPPPNFYCQNGNGYEKSDNYPHIVNDNDVLIGDDKAEDVDDGQFEEDATSVEDNYQISIGNEKFLFENNTKINVQNCNPSKQDVKIENTNANIDEHDSDRMFLLSLLPYLRKVKEHRKLNVRQRLQDVLIQEFG